MIYPIKIDRQSIATNTSTTYDPDAGNITVLVSGCDRFCYTTSDFGQSAAPELGSAKEVMILPRVA